MSEETKVTDEVHRELARKLFNQTWDLLDKEERTLEEDSQMIHSAHASRYHWGVVGTPVHLARGEWQISRVYSTLGRGEPAVYHAKLSLGHCEKNNIKDFDLAFAYEALARSYTVSGLNEKASEYYDLAENAGRQIKEEADRKYFMDELASVKP